MSNNWPADWHHIWPDAYSLEIRFPLLAKCGTLFLELEGVSPVVAIISSEDLGNILRVRSSGPIHTIAELEDYIAPFRDSTIPTVFCLKISVATGVTNFDHITWRAATLHTLK